MDNKKTYFITGGGTGGHIYPAIAVADELLQQDDTAKVFYVGNPNKLSIFTCYILWNAKKNKFGID